MAQVGAFSTEPLADALRGACRHHLWLGAEAAVGGSTARVLIHNLSSSGLLIESALELELGEEFDVELPEKGPTRAEVVWRSESFYGCQFARPVSGAAISAARLRSPSSFSVPERTPDFGPSRMVADEDMFGDAAASSDLTPRQKLATIVGLALACWLVIGLVVFFAA